MVPENFNFDRKEVVSSICQRKKFAMPVIPLTAWISFMRPHKGLLRWVFVGG
jgi:hypothetical protein